MGIQPITNPATFSFVHTKRFKLILSVVTAGFVYLFLLFFQPFGVNNYRPDESINVTLVFVLFLFAIIVFVSMLLVELFIKPLLFKQFNLITITVWILLQVLIISTITFLFYNFLGEFHDFYLASYLKHILQIGVVLAFPIVAIHFYFKHTAVVKNLEEVLSFPSQSKNLDELVLLSGDYKKDSITVLLKNIVFLESQDNYVALHYLEGVALKKYLIRSSLSKVAQTLDPKVIVRCNRAQLINIVHIASTKTVNGTYLVQLNKVINVIKVSKANRANLLEAMQNYTS